MAVHRKGLAVRRELAGRPGADAEAVLDVVRASMPSAMRSVRPAIGPGRVRRTARPSSWPRGCGLGPRGRRGPIRARQSLAVRREHGGPAQEAAEENLATTRRAQAILRELVAGDPSDTRYLEELGQGHFQIGYTLAASLGRPAEAIAEYEEAIAIYRKLADSRPEVHRLQNTLAKIHNNISAVAGAAGAARRGGRPAAPGRGDLARRPRPTPP